MTTTTQELHRLVDEAPDKTGLPALACFLRQHLLSFTVKGYREERIRECNTSSAGIWKLCEAAYPDPVKRKSLMAACALVFASKAKTPAEFVSETLSEPIYVATTPEERQQQYDMLEAKIKELLYPASP